MIQARTQSLVRFAAIDTILVAAACLIPAASHLLALPLYMLNPMLTLLLAGLLIGRDWRNALVLAVVMPLASSIMTGMPVADKMFCMMAELLTVVTVFHFLGSFNINFSKVTDGTLASSSEFQVADTKLGVLLASLLAIAAGKVVYYILKAIVIAPAVLVGTDWKMQLGAALVWSGLFAALMAKGKR